MALPRFRTFLRGLTQAVPDSDRDLLRRFAESRDEAAFGVLVGRYGGLVYGVCRRVLRNDSDAEDAFQATFLVLARKAGRLAVRDNPIGGWLYRTATYVALVARSAEFSRVARERHAAMIPTDHREAQPDETWADVWPVLDEAVQELPDKYGRPVTLCYLLGYTHAQAAAELGLPIGSVSRQVARGLELLRDRLSGRGVALSVAALVGALTQTQAGAAPAAIVERTTRLAVLDSLSEGSATVPNSVTSLVRAVTGSGTASRLVWVAVIAVVGAMLAGAAAFTEHPTNFPPSPANASPIPARAPAPEKTETLLAGRVVDSDGKPVAKADIAAFVRPDTKPNELREPDRAIQVGRTDANGHFKLSLPAELKTDALRLMVSSVDKGFAIAPVTLPIEKKVTVRLSKPQAVQGMVTDERGRPVKGARVRAWIVGDVRIDPSQDIDRDPQPVPFWPAPVTTKDDGLFTFPSLSGAGKAVLEIIHPDFARVDLPWRSRDGQKAEDLTVRLPPPKEVVGQVLSQKTGKPVAGAKVAFTTRVVIENPPSSTCVIQQTDAEGRFRLLPHRTELLHIIVLPPAASGLTHHTEILDLDGLDKATVEIPLKEAPRK